MRIEGQSIMPQYLGQIIPSHSGGNIRLLLLERGYPHEQVELLVLANMR